MSDRRIGDSGGFRTMMDEDTSYAACKGSPALIQPGAVVAMASALESIINAGAWYDSALEIDEYRDGAIGGEELERKARAALAMYNGEE